MGSRWKMFTQTQGKELIKGTNSKWVTSNGVNGRMFTSKTNSSKHIFLPAGDWWSNTNLVKWNRGWYWTTVLNTSVTDGAKFLTFMNNSIEISGSSSYGRFPGFSVRAISQSS